MFSSDTIDSVLVSFNKILTKLEKVVHVHNTAADDKEQEALHLNQEATMHKQESDRASKIHKKISALLN